MNSCSYKWQLRNFLKMDTFYFSREAQGFKRWLRKNSPRKSCTMKLFWVHALNGTTLEKSGKMVSLYDTRKIQISVAIQKSSKNEIFCHFCALLGVGNHCASVCQNSHRESKTTYVRTHLRTTGWFLRAIKSSRAQAICFHFP